MNHKTAGVLAGDAGLAGIQWLLQGDEPLASLRGSLSTLLPDPELLQGCRLHRAKYKPRRHLTAYYEATVRDPATGAEQIRHVEAVWLPPGSAGPRGAPADQEIMQEELRRRGLCAPFLGLAAEDAAWGLWLRVSPLDAEYPQIARLSDPAYISEPLARATGRPLLAGGYTVSIVRYRPGQRHVLRYDPASAGGQAGEGTLFAKSYNSDKGQRIFSVVSSIEAWLAAQGAGLRTVRPAAYMAAEQTVLYPWVTGTPLTSLLQSGPTADELLVRAGSALRVLHSVPLDLVELKPHSLAKEIKSIASATEHIHTLLPETGAQIDAILKRAEALHDRMPHELPGFAYGDYKCDHLWVTPAGLTLIDFDTCYFFDPAIDLGKFLADLRWWYDQFGLAGVERAQAHFLDGYTVPPQRLARARLYEVLVLVKTTARRVKLFDGAWAERTGRLIAAAGRLLDDLAAAV